MLLHGCRPRQVRRIPRSARIDRASRMDGSAWARVLRQEDTQRPEGCSGGPLVSAENLRSHPRVWRDGTLPVGQVAGRAVNERAALDVNSILAEMRLAQAPTKRFGHDKRTNIVGQCSEVVAAVQSIAASRVPSTRALPCLAARGRFQLADRANRAELALAVSLTPVGAPEGRPSPGAASLHSELYNPLRRRSGDTAERSRRIHGSRQRSRARHVVRGPD
jgi:hypothetical protein